MEDVVLELREPPEWLEVDDGAELPRVIPDWVLHGLPVAPEPPCECGGTCCALADLTRVGRGDGPLADLQRAAAELARREPSTLPPAQALSESAALLKVLQQLRVHQLDRLADVSDRQLHALAGHRSTTSWLRQAAPDADLTDLRLTGTLAELPVLARAVRGGLSLRAAKRVVTALGRVRRHVDVDDGLIEGQPGEDVVTAVVRNVLPLIARSRAGLTDRDGEALLQALGRIIDSAESQLSRLEAGFTLLAQHIPAGELTDALDQLVLSVLPSLLDKRAAQGRDRAGLVLERRSDGTGWQLQGDLDLECGERLFTALSAEVRRDPANPADTAAAAELRAEGLEPYGEQAPTDRQRPRARKERLHDAFSRLLGRHLDSGLAGTHHKVPVQVSVTMEVAGVDGLPGALPARGDSGAPVPRSMVRRWWCDSRVTAFIFTRTGKALRAVHVGRTLTALERRAALLEHDNRCAGVGCCRGRPDPAVPLRPHHVRRFADDGISCIQDTAMVCDTLHHDLHEGGKTVLLRDGRRLNERGWVEQ